jgi:adenosylcobinamide-phosphate synthase
MLVSRDTAVLDARGVRRALAETVSENFNDGFLAPLFFLVLGGPGLLWAYKAISTMDSMWGYRTAAYRELGWAPARADDVLAWIPARLSALFLAAGGLVLGLKWRGALAKTAVQAQEMDSPNAGWPMAAAAWLLGAGMGGPTSYSGTMKPKPWLGPAPGEWTDGKLACLERLCLVSALLAVLLFAVLTGLVRMSLI